MGDLLTRVDTALEGTAEENAYNNNFASPIPDEGRTAQGIASTAWEQAGRVAVKAEPLTKSIDPNLPLPF